MPQNPAIEEYSAVENACPCKRAKQACTRACHFGSIRNCLRDPTQADLLIGRRLEEISALGECGFVVGQHNTSRIQFGPGMQEAEEFWFTESPSRRPRLFDFIAGCPQETCLYGASLDAIPNAGARYPNQARMADPAWPRTVPESPYRVGSSFEQLQLTYDEIIEMFKLHRFSPSALIEYLHTGSTKCQNSKGPWYPPLLPHATEKPASIVKNAMYRSLRALAYAADVYKLLPTSTVAMSTILFRNLYKAQWILNGLIRLNL